MCLLYRIYPSLDGHVSSLCAFDATKNPPNVVSKSLNELLTTKLAPDGTLGAAFSPPRAWLQIAVDVLSNSETSPPTSYARPGMPMPAGCIEYDTNANYLADLTGMRSWIGM